MVTLLSIIALTVLAVGILNSAFMLFAPSRWLDLPKWLALRGGINRSMIISLIGNIGIRITGALGLLSFSWMAIGLLNRLHATQIHIVPIPRVLYPVQWRSDFLLVACLVGFGIFMIYQSPLYYRWFFAGQLRPTADPRIYVKIIRIIGIILICAGLFVIWKLLI